MSRRLQIGSGRPEGKGFWVAGRLYGVILSGPAVIAATFEYLYAMETGGE
jgi:hypothetical protein